MRSYRRRKETKSVKKIKNDEGKKRYNKQEKKGEAKK
jgi:hypothetical protein